MSGPNWLDSIVLRDQRDGSGLRYLAAKRRTGGGIVIEGQDLGPGVERVWGLGNREYEWAWSVGPDAVTAMVAALEGIDGDDPLRLLGEWYEAHGGMDPGIHIRDAGVAIEFWSRVGD